MLCKRISTFLVYEMTYLLVSACGSIANQESSDLDNGQADPTGQQGEAEFDLSKTSDEIPMAPRRKLSQQIEWFDKSKISVGLETGFAGTSFATKTSVEFEKHYSIVVWLFAPGDKDALIDEGDVFLANTPSRPYSFICRFEAYYNANAAVLGSISLFGSGFEKSKGMSERTSVLQTSPIFPVEVGSSWPSIFQKCRSYGEQSDLKESIDRDLKAMTKNMIYHDSKSECILDSHCSDWHRNYLPLVQKWTVPVCETRSNNARYCSLKGKKSSSCSLYRKDSGTGKLERLTKGAFEYSCQKDLKCTVQKQGGWFKNGEIYSYWEGACL